MACHTDCEPNPTLSCDKALLIDPNSVQQVMDGGGEELLGGGLAVSQSRGQLVALRQQLVHLGDDPLLFG